MNAPIKKIGWTLICALMSAGLIYLGAIGLLLTSYEMAWVAPIAFLVLGAANILLAIAAWIKPIASVGNVGQILSLCVLAVALWLYLQNGLNAGTFIGGVLFGLAMLGNALAMRQLHAQPPNHALQATPSSGRT